VGDRDELVLSSPLGQALAEIVSDAGGAFLTAGDGRSQSAANVDSLLQTVLGYPLPLTGWSTGCAAVTRTPAR
jgi:outer membrane lipoprotein LolB